MTATSTSTPFSALPPSTYGPNPLGPFSFSLTFPSHRGTNTQHRPSLVLGSMYPMGLNLKDKVPVLLRKPSTSKLREPLPEVTNRDSLPAVERLNGTSPPKLSNRFLSGSLHRVRRTRSISSLFQPANGDAQPIVLDTVSTSPPVNDQPAPVLPVEKKTVSVVLEGTEETQGEEKGKTFQRKNHFLTKSGMKHHPYPDEAPYMQAYDPILLDNDRFTDMLLRRLNSNGSPTFHDYGSKPPSNVLDLGCGHGRWVVEAATTWRSFGTKVTGFDLVNVSGHSWEVDEAILDNVTWVQGNFLKYKLPFADQSFDLVRMANLSLAIPHDKWLPLFTEVRRVLTPGGRLELIDDQIIFPYNQDPPILTHHRKRSASSFDSDYDSDDDTDNTEASSTLIDHNVFLERVPQVPRGLSTSQDAPADWQTHATNSKGLETIFENMLLQNYGIHSQPQDLIDIMLAHVFGSQHADRMKTMHLALAPADQVEPAERIDADVGVKTSPSVDEKSDDEMVAVDESQTHKQSQDERAIPERLNQLSSFEPKTISPKAASLLGINITDQINAEADHPIQVAERTSGRTISRLKISPSMVWREKWSGMMARGRRASVESLRSSEIPESVRLNAPERLGIIAQTNRRLSCESNYSQSSELEVTPFDLHLGDRTRGDSMVPNTISPKAASRLGITTSSLGTTQSPGLILWPSTFIPLEPLELEMHACKNMHVLLGCKAALWDFIQDVKGADGTAHISQDEFNELTWEYECFRRKRFNWPAEAPRSRSPIPSSATIQRSATIRSTTSPSSESLFFKRPGSSSGRLNGGAGGPLASSTMTTSYKREALTFVRAFRVYEAWRVEEQENKPIHT